jgi:hypothetical protein
MPIITSFPDPFRTYNRVEVNWADTPSVTAARVLRVNPATGECVPLRPYVCFEGDYLKLSCGLGVFWDTEVPLDTPVYYITEGLEAPCIPADEYFFRDTFTRILVDSWGSTETGTLGPLPYALAGGTVGGNYDVNGGKGRMTLDGVAGVDRTASIDIGMTDFDLYATFSVNQLALSDAATTRIMARFMDANNHYQGGMNWSQDGSILIFLTRILAGVQTILAIQFAVGTYTPDVEWTLRYQGIGNDFKLKAWPAAGVQPAAWNLEATDTPQPTLNSTLVGILARRDPANTNVGLIASTDNFFMVNDCIPCTPVTAETTESTMPSGGVFRLKDPVRPCHDQAMPLCFTQPNLADINGEYCIPGSGIFFAQMDTESYDSNSLLLGPVNAKYPIQVSRTRRGVESTLQVVTRTFADRDALLTLNDPGSPVLIQAPPAYGIMDTYMAISTVGVERGLTDHRFQVRVLNLPFIAVARPAGPMQGPCGSQMDNLCDIYTTWGELEASGLTWADLIRGRASTAGGPGPAGIQTWDDVQATYVDWDAAQVGNTWIDIEQGT